MRLGQLVPYLRMLALAALVATSLFACGDRQTPLQFRGTDITGSSIGGDFSMSDHTGQTRKLSDFRGKVVLLFFGYTHCPDVCPTTLSEVAAALKELGPKASEVQVVFVTVDPDRDTQALLAQYVPAFNPRFMALRGNESSRTARTPRRSMSPRCQIISSMVVHSPALACSNFRTWCGTPCGMPTEHACYRTARLAPEVSARARSRSM